MVNLIAAPVDLLQSRSEFPRRVEIHSNIRIPLADGCWLHARAWMPEGAAANPVPALVEYAPFRHRDFTAPRDALIHPWFAGHGYASLRVELRGSGDSAGIPRDEYVLQEQDDALQALDWIAAQGWCDGNTGMFGMSWGAFSALQVAARKPPSLKAIIPVHGTDDRFADDIHYKGGCLLSAGLSWGTLYTLYMMRPPDPELSGEVWRQQWLKRFDACPLVLPEWMSHQYRDDYWRHGSICEDYSQLNCPALIACGWADGYTNAALRMAEHLPEPSRVLIGPWAHTYPHLAQPGPQIGFLQEAVKWWDRWLKGRDNEVEQLPRLRLWLQDSTPPASSYEQRDGEWLGFEGWPSCAVYRRRWFLQPDRLEDSMPEESVLEIESPLANAIDGPEWLPHGVGPELPVDQEAEDEGSLCFDTAVLESELVICGAVEVRLRLRTNTPVGIVSVRLVDLFEDGRATQISYGLLNLVHRHGLDKPEPVVPGEWFDLVLSLNDIAQRIPRGHRLRVAISTQAWPLVWPSRQTMTLELLLGKCTMALPLLDPEKIGGLKSARPDSAAIPETLSLVWQRPVKRERTIARDAATGCVSRVYLKDDGAFRIEEHGMEIDAWGSLTYRSRGEDPRTAEAEYRYRLKHARGEWNAGVECEVRVTADAENFYVTGEYRAIEDNRVIKRRVVEQPVRRKYV
ncbi:MAG: CocE/NonD family hydrolase [Gammaproteobacteria bacterium]|nr:CocE/NonD family hydrolase [Gammaproteobacteria bacterium]